MTVDIDQMRKDWPLDDDHKATRYPFHCDVCGLRMPCPWSEIVTDLHQVLDELELTKGYLMPVFPMDPDRRANKPQPVYPGTHPPPPKPKPQPKPPKK